MAAIRRRGLAVMGGVILIVAGLVAAPTAGAQTDVVTGSFDLLSYNVAGLPEGISGSNPSVNMALISPLLNAYDLVLTQEDFANPDPPLDGVRVYHDDLISQVDFPYLSTPQVPPLGSDPDHPDALLGDGLNFLSRFALGPVDRVTWDDCMGIADHASDCLATKGFAKTTIELGPGATVDVYDLHADAGGAVEDQAARASNIAQLGTYIKAHSAGHAVIVGGDTNLHTDRPTAATVWRDFLDDTGLADVCDTVDCGADADVIDKIAFRNGGGVDLTAESHVFERARFTRADGEPLSDHDPLHVRFAYSARIDPVPTTAAPTPTTVTSTTSTPTSVSPTTVPSTTSSVPPTTSTSVPTSASTTVPRPSHPSRVAPAPAARAVAGTPAYTG